MDDKELLCPWRRAKAIHWVSLQTAGPVLNVLQPGAVTSASTGWEIRKTRSCLFSGVCGSALSRFCKRTLVRFPTERRGDEFLSEFNSRHKIQKMSIYFMWALPRILIERIQVQTSLAAQRLAAVILVFLRFSNLVFRIWFDLPFEKVSLKGTSRPSTQYCIYIAWKFSHFYISASKYLDRWQHQHSTKKA